MKTASKLGLLTSLYLCQGLPYGFFTQALPVLLRREGLSLPDIGLSNLLALPWALKFVWAPLLDRRGPSAAGRRRGVILPLQAASALLLLVLALFPPQRGLTPLLAGVLLVNLLAATQDIATDALAVDLLAPAERGLGNGVQVGGYRVGMILGGGVLVLFLDRIGWSTSFFAMSLAVALASVPVLLFREPARLAAPPGDAPGLRSTARAWLGAPGPRGWLLLLLLFKTGESLATGMLRTFLYDAGLGLPQIGLMLGAVGFTAGLLGALLGGALVTRMGRRPALVAFGSLQTAAIGLYSCAALFGASLLGGGAGLGAFYAVAAFEHLASGMATAALFTAMMDRCRPGHEATDYTVQACVVVLATGGAAAASGFSAQRFGYPAHFALSAAVSLVGVAYAAGQREAPVAPAASVPAPVESCS